MGKRSDAPKSGREAFCTGHDVSANPHRDMLDKIQWVADWWQANAEAFWSHVHGHELVGLERRQRKLRLDLLACMAQHPTAHLAWDGNCPAGDTSNLLRAFSYDAERNVIELEFD